MKTLITALVALFIFLPVQAFAQDTPEGEEKEFKVQAWDFSDYKMGAVKGESCAEFLNYLMKSRARYKITAVSSLTGPPGVVYTLTNWGGDVAIIKCGTCGGGHEGDGGGH